MATVAKWNDADRLRAITLAHATSQSEASRQTGIPMGTIGKWMAATKKEEEKEEGREEEKRPSKNAREAAQEAIAEAKVIARDLIVDDIASWATAIKDLGLLSVNEATRVIKMGNPDNAQWLRSLVGVLAQSTEKYQLLTGKPTSRSEIKGELQMKEEHTQRIVHELLQGPAIENRWLMAVERAKLPKVGEPME